MKNVRVVSRQVSSRSSAGRRKFTTGLQKCGYWVPGVAWENCLFGGAVDAVLADESKSRVSREVSLPCLGAACQMFAFRYMTGRLLEADGPEITHAVFFKRITPQQCTRLLCIKVSDQKSTHQHCTCSMSFNFAVELSWCVSAPARCRTWVHSLTSCLNHVLINIPGHDTVFNIFVCHHTSHRLWLILPGRIHTQSGKFY